MPSTPSTRSTRIVAAAAGVVILAGVTACGSGNDKGGSGGGDGGSNALSPLAALRKTSQNTDQQKTAKVSGTQSQGTPQGQAKSEMKGEMDWSGGGTTANMTITQTGGAGAAGSPQGSKPMKVRYTKDAMYVGLGDQSLGGKRWIAYDYDKLSQKGGASGALVKDQMQNNNPSRSVDMLLAGGDVHKAGTATVKGKQTTHYTGTVDVADMTRKQSKDLSESQLDQITAALKKQGIKNETIDLWIDGDNLLAKKRERYTSKTGKADSTAVYTDYGTKVSVQAPPASGTVPFDKLGGGAAAR